jgi:outer membrane receptor protein involved in Fe transport
MSWDQRHTFNASLGYNTGRYGTTLSLYYNSGHPYTWSPMPESPLSRVNLFPNNSHIPSSFSVDLTSYYKLMAYKGMQYRLTLLVYNLFDRLNEVFVNSTTGRAYTAILREIDIANHRSDFNDVYDSIQNPAMYSAPRQVKVGLEVSF